MTAVIPHRTPPIHPTTTEYEIQAKALEIGGKPAEVLVKAARDLIVFASIYSASGSGTNGVHRYRLESAASRYCRHALTAGATELGADPIAQAGHAALLLCRYLS